MVNGKCKLHWQLAKGMEWFGLECAHLSHYPGLKRAGGGGGCHPTSRLATFNFDIRFYWQKTQRIQQTAA